MSPFRSAAPAFSWPKGSEWRRQRKLLAPTFTPSSINVLMPHFHEAARHLLLGVEGKPSVNLSEAFQDAALEAVLRALFSMPEIAPVKS